MAFLLASYTVTSMSLTFALYRETADVIRTLFLPGGPVTRGPWHKNSQTWPTLLLLITSGIFWTFSLIVMAMYLKGIKAANKAVAQTGNIAYGLYAVEIFVWIATAVAYRKGKTGSDLWGWSCTKQAELIQPFYRDKVNFVLFCRIQVRFISYF